MRHLLALLCLALLLPACRQVAPASVDDDLYGVVNAYIKKGNRWGGIPTVVIFEKVSPLYRSAAEGEFPPPPPGSIWTKEYYDSYFEELVEKGILDQTDVDSMQVQLSVNDSQPDLVLDSTRMSIPVMTEAEYARIFPEDEDLMDCWGRYHSKYKGYKLTFRQPLFSADRSKAYFHTGRSYGSLSGYGEAVVMKRGVFGWRIIFRKETWIS